MKTNNIVQHKSFEFAIGIIELYKYLISDKKEFILSKQILKSGTSIGANIEESAGTQSKRDFINKISISYKELRETIYWLKLLHGASYITDGQFELLFSNATELGRLISSILKTSKEKYL
jgi:four helix bundle protein